MTRASDDRPHGKGRGISLRGYIAVHKNMKAAFIILSFNVCIRMTCGFMDILVDELLYFPSFTCAHASRQDANAFLFMTFLASI